MFTILLLLFIRDILVVYKKDPHWTFICGVIWRTSSIKHQLTMKRIWARVQDACRIVRRNPDVFERQRQSYGCRAQACVENDGGHVEHVYMYVCIYVYIHMYIYRVSHFNLLRQISRK